MMPRGRPPLIRSYLHQLRLLPRHLTSGARVLPDFIIIGAQKAGTASLYNYLVQHPQVRRAARKEVHFFDRKWHQGERWYRAFFPTTAQMTARPKGVRPVTGEASPYYLFHPAVPARVHALLPGVRLIALLRDPIDRAYSQYNFYVAKGYERRSFAEALAAERRDEVVAGITEQTVEARRANGRYRYPFYLARGMYAEQLQRWLALFPREQLDVHDSSRFFRQTQSVVTAVQRHLGLPEAVVDTRQIANQTRYAPMDAGLRRELEATYRAPNEQLFELVGQRFNWS